MELEKLEMYKMSMDIGERIWDWVIQLDHFSKETIGNQIVRSSDSIVANISDGVGAFHLGIRKGIFIIQEDLFLKHSPGSWPLASGSLTISNKN